MKTKKGNFLMGLLLLFLSFYLFVDPIINNYPIPVILTVIVAMCIIFFTLSYLTPHFNKKDERMRLIREKAMFYSYFFIVFYFFTFIILIGFNIITISAFNAVLFLASLILITFFLIMVFIARIY